MKILLHCFCGAVGLGSVKPLGKQTLSKHHSTEFSTQARDQEMKALLCLRAVLPHLLGL